MYRPGAQHTEHLGRERLVQLDQPDVIECQPKSSQHLLRRRHRTDTHYTRRYSRHRRATDSRQQAQPVCERFAHLICGGAGLCGGTQVHVVSPKGTRMAFVIRLRVRRSRSGRDQTHPQAVSVINCWNGASKAVVRASARST